LWWTERHWGTFPSKYFGFPPVNTIPPTLHIIFFLILISSEGQAGEDWETLNNVMSYEISGRTRKKSTFKLPFYSRFKGFSNLRVRLTQKTSTEII
jgi:hypothetical protein